MFAGLKAAAAPGQWSYSIGPCQGIALGDQLWLSRYILLRLTEQFKLIASLDPKPVPGDWSSSGAFVKYSTADTRNPAVGLRAIDAHIRSLQQVRPLFSFGLCSHLSPEQVLSVETALHSHA